MRILACSLLLIASVQAQEYVFRPYRQTEGLKNLSVKALSVDHSGFLWVGTENGVYRFLGTEFEQYGLEQGIAERDIQSVFTDPMGGVWVGTYENLYHWNGRRFDPAGKQPISIWGSWRMVAEDTRHLLVVDKNKLHRLELDDSGNMRSYLPVFSREQVTAVPSLQHLSSVSLVAQRAEQRTVWLGCGKKLCSWSSSSGSQGRLVEEWGPEKGIPDDFWHSVVLDRSGLTWAVGEHHVVALTAGEARFRDRGFPIPDPNGVYGRSAVVLDRMGRLLVATDEGIARWEGSSWRLIGPANGLRSSHLTDLALGETGDLWLGSIGHGLIQWVGYENWEGWNDLNGLPSASIWAIEPLKDGRLMIGTEKGPARIDLRAGLVTSFSSGKKWTYGQISGLGHDSNGTLWAGTFSGALLRISPTTGKAREVDKLPALVISAIQDSEGRVLFLTGGGVFLREPGAAETRRVASLDAMLGTTTDAQAGCVAPDGATWVLANNRLLREKSDKWSAPPIDGMATLRGQLVVLACARDGALWASGRQGGTWRFTFAEGRIHASPLVYPTQFDQLAPLAILADRRGWIWLGTDEGLIVWNGREWRHLTQESGLIWNDVNQGVLRESADGSLYVGTSGGLAHLVHPEQVFDNAPLAVSITDLERAGAEYQLGESITLPWASSPLRFQISSPAMRNRSELRFAYRMDGLQQEWIESENGEAVFSALPPGSYTFEAVARNASLNAVSKGVTMQVTILPPWWRNGWMLAVYAVGFMLLVILFDWIRARNLKRVSRQLQRLVAARTSELELSREQMRIQATHDALTGLLNRAAILRTLSAELDRARTEGKNLVVVLADLDHFKEINDTFGHLAGDEALRQFATAAKVAIRPDDHVGRYGGEEFLLILTDVPEEFDESRLTSLHTSITDLLVHGPQQSFRVNCSLGATIIDPATVDTEGSELILGAADLALYDAKAAGRNRVIWRRFTVPGEASSFAKAPRNEPDLRAKAIDSEGLPNILK